MPRRTRYRSGPGRTSPSNTRVIGTALVEHRYISPARDRAPGFPRSIAGLLGESAWVFVRPPLLVNGPSCGSMTPR